SLFLHPARPPLPPPHTLFPYTTLFRSPLHTLAFASFQHQQLLRAIFQPWALDSDGMDSLWDRENDPATPHLDHQSVFHAPGFVVSSGNGCQVGPVNFSESIDGAGSLFQKCEIMSGIVVVVCNDQGLPKKSPEQHIRPPCRTHNNAGYQAKSPRQAFRHSHPYRRRKMLLPVISEKLRCCYQCGLIPKPQ